METIVTAALLSIIWIIVSVYYDQVPESNFENWSIKYGKSYSQEEKLFRRNIYIQNKNIIDEHNNMNNTTYQMKENQFMTLTKEEYIELFLNNFESITNSTFYNQEISQLKAVDWRSYSTVKTQGNCIAGWAFSVTNSIEAWYFIRGGKNITVSTQQFIDCDTNSIGCQGGKNQNAMKYAMQSGLVNSITYPYTGLNQTCKYQSGSYKINNYTFVGNSSSALQSALQNYPVSVGVDAQNWQFYSSGLFSNCKFDAINHYALAVGFDLSGNWIVQNSFGLDWGEQGHINLLPNNTCGILNEAYQIL